MYFIALLEVPHLVSSFFYAFCGCILLVTGQRCMPLCERDRLQLEGTQQVIASLRAFLMELKSCEQYPHHNLQIRVIASSIILISSCFNRYVLPILENFGDILMCSFLLYCHPSHDSSIRKSSCMIPKAKSHLESKTSASRTEDRTQNLLGFL